MSWRRWVLVLVMAAPLAALSMPARIQDGSADVCWEPDHEFPVPCDDDED